MAVTKKGTCFESAALTGVQLLALDRALANLVLQSDCLTLSAKDELAAMQARLRRIRVALEVECGLPDLGRAAAGPSGIPLYTGSRGADDLTRLTSGNDLTYNGLARGKPT